MHSYGHWPDERFSEVEHASYFIGDWLKKWARMPVRQCKEKFGTVRVYCGFGWEGIYTIWRPGYMWYPKWWPRQLDRWIADTSIFKLLNRTAAKLQQHAYVWRYKKAIQKWPHLYNEIVSMADWGELFDGKIPGYKHSDYWRTVK